MSISGKYYIKKWIPDPKLVHGDDFNPGGPGGPGEPLDGPGGPDDPVASANTEKSHVKLPDYGQPNEGFFEGEMTFVFEAQPDGTLKGTADGAPINSGFYTGDEFFKVDYPAGPGRWEIWARVDQEGNIIGMVSVGGGGGFPNFVYGKKIN